MSEVTRLYPIVLRSLCDCGKVETTRHYLLECISFDNFRQSMLNNMSHLSPPSVNILIVFKLLYQCIDVKYILAIQINLFKPTGI